MTSLLNVLMSVVCRYSFASGQRRDVEAQDDAVQRVVDRLRVDEVALRDVADLGMGDRDLRLAQLVGDGLQAAECVCLQHDARLICDNPGLLQLPGDLVLHLAHVIFAGHAQCRAGHGSSPGPAPVS